MGEPRYPSRELGRDQLDAVLGIAALLGWRVVGKGVAQPSARIPDGVRVGPWASVGRYAHIGEKVTIRGGTCIGDSASIGAWSTIGDGAQIGERARLGESVIVGADASIGVYAFVGSGTHLGADVNVGADASIAAGGRVADGASVAEDSIVATVDIGRWTVAIEVGKSETAVWIGCQRHLLAEWIDDAQALAEEHGATPSEVAVLQVMVPALVEAQQQGTGAA